MHEDYIWVRDIFVKTEDRTEKISIEVRGRDHATIVRINGTPIDKTYPSQKEAISGAIKNLGLVGKTVSLDILINSEIMSVEEVESHFKETGVDVSNSVTH